MISKAFKVVYMDRSFGFFSGYCNRYEINEFSFPAIGKILVFDNFDNACDFILRHDKDTCHIKILCGDAKNIKYIKKLCAFSGHFGVFWDNYRKKKGHNSLSTFKAPKGTMACDWFKPKKEIHTYCIPRFNKLIGSKYIEEFLKDN